MKKEIKVEITEVFMAKAGKGNKGFDRCFYGTIVRKRDENNNPVVYGKIKVNDSYVIAMAENQWELGEKLDQLVLYVLNYCK
jgi:hypothetical protein